MKGRGCTTGAVLRLDRRRSSPSAESALERTVERLTKDGLDTLTAMLAERIGDPRVLPDATDGYSLRRTVAHAVRGIEAYLHLAAGQPTGPELAAARAQAEDLWTVLERATVLLDPAALTPQEVPGQRVLPDGESVTRNVPSSSDALRATLTTARAGHVLVLRLAGELDLDGVTVLEEVPQEGTTAVVLDLSRLDFCDSSGLNVLLRMRLAAENRGIRVHLAAASQQVARLFEITGTNRVFRTHPSVEEALADLAYD
jgi:anti-anti-sigma factor